MLFLSKRKKIRAEQFIETEPWPNGVFRRDDGTYAVHNALHDSDIKIETGQWVRVDNPDDIYPISSEYLAANYEPLEGE